jgi:hypothetical protein
MMRTLALVSFVLAAACGDDSTEPSLEEEACEHLQEGPAVARTATAAAAGAPAVSNDHMRYDVALVDVTGGKGGFITFAAAEAGDYVFFFSADVPLAVTTSAGQPVTIAGGETGSDLCTELARSYDVPLTVGTFNLQLGPTSATSVSIVVEEEGEHTHE